MKLALLLLTLILTTAQANLGTYKNGKFIFPGTNIPYTGNLDVLNNDWGKDAVEINRDYVDGIIQGTEKSYYQSGKLKSVGFFSKGRLEGFVTAYYEDGSVEAKVLYKNGLKEGRALFYYPNGNKQVEQFYVNNELDGLNTTWFESGNLMEVVTYSKGMLHGTGKTYYEAGGVFEEVKFEYGTPKFMRVYREDGTLADEKGWIDKKIIERIVG